MKFPEFDYVRPDSLTAALALLAEDPEMVPLAGGQSLLTMMGFRLALPERLLDIGRLPELMAVTEADGVLAIGAAVCHAALEDGAAPGALGGFLARAAGNIGYRAIRNRGTLGGSLCQADPAADWPTVLLALDAEVELAAATGRRRLPLAEFIEGEMTTARAPDELLVAVHLPVVTGAGYGVHKIARKQGEFANAIAAAVHHGEGRLALAVGLVSGRPLRLDCTLDPAAIDLAARLTGTAAYRDLSDRIAAAAPEAGDYPRHLAAIAALHAAHATTQTDGGAR